MQYISYILSSLQNPYCGFPISQIRKVKELDQEHSAGKKSRDCWGRGEGWWWGNVPGVGEARERSMRREGAGREDIYTTICNTLSNNKKEQRFKPHLGQFFHHINSRASFPSHLPKCIWNQTWNAFCNEVDQRDFYFLYLLYVKIWGGAMNLLRALCKHSVILAANQL